MKSGIYFYTMLNQWSFTYIFYKKSKLSALKIHIFDLLYRCKEQDMIEIDNLKVSYGDKKVLDIKEKLEFKDGEKIGIIGSNGAGKTTLIKAILGIIPFSGNIVTGIPRREIAVHMQFNNYSESVSTRDIIQMVANSKIENDKSLSELIEFFDFKKLLKKSFKELSGGEKQKLTLILVMWKDSPITMFDEVTTGLDFVTRQMLMEKILDYYKGKSTSILLVSHYYEELENICDKLLYIHKGRVLFFGSKKEMFNKYCTKSVILTEDNDITNSLIGKEDRIVSMANKIAAGFDDSTREKDLINKLVENDQNFERLNESIELTVLNALSKEGYDE